ncbi:type IV secretory system conjugative DNA transfer family protein [Desulfotomaculum copahuensis]|uniref:Type IV secretion system protein VirD4 n=1 Tax=Desulfotomaculum copahuensis TaxID=1838280 RepID=A0A1B7LJR6_9FIRM|nr:TraM recognition domain-containing protein [Desulfotomaculum copahuensis]OAT86809.1 type IV secretion system protein VirD4 [Desulfotomaculum copahuensis]
MINLRNLQVPELGKFKIPLIILAAGLGLAGAYIVLSVWLLGTAAAWLHGAAVRFNNYSLFATAAQKGAAAHAYDSVGWYWHHPFKTAWAWLTTPAAKLNAPQIRVIWFMLNVPVFAALGGIVYLVKRRNWKQEQDYRDIRKIRFVRVKYDIHRYLERTPANQVFLGLDDRRRPITIPVSDLVEHIHILGGSGSGKTAFAVTPLCIQAIRRGMAAVVIDFKGDRQAVQLIAREAKAAGKKFYFFTLAPVKCNTYNPLASGTALAKSERIMTALDLVFDGAGKFYTYVQQAIFIPLLKFFDAQRVKYAIGDVLYVLKDKKLLEKMTGEEVNPEQIKGLTAALTAYADMPQINAAKADIDLAAVMKAGDVVYFDLRSALAPEASSGIGKMISQDLQYIAAYRTPQSQPVVIAIDEFQNMACQAFRNVISKVRTANYAMILANQATGDLQAVGDDFVNTIRINTRTKIVFSADDPADARLFADYSGSILQTVTNRSESRSQPPLSFSDRRYSVGENITEIEVPLLHPNVIKSLPPGKSIIIRRNELATLSNHSYLVTKMEKDELERLPLPDPVPAGPGPAVPTVADLVARMKRDLVNQPDGGRQRPTGGKPPAANPAAEMANAGNAEAEDIAL